MTIRRNEQGHEIRHLTLLHSNDLHGDFLAEEIDEKLIGGVSMLSGYVNQVRRENPNTLYMIAGDMFRGSLIDTEFQGISTIEIMNLLSPDIVSLGNHEMDYGIAHLLFLEKCCRFPIVNANIYIKTNGARLFHSHRILQVDGMKILVIGIITEEIMGRAKADTLLGTFVDVHDAANEVAAIVNGYKGVDIDFTILLTHIGYINDRALAAELDPELGVDVIVGGHSHTLLEKPDLVNDILIVQAGIGTDQIGRFELDIDVETNSVDSFTWETVPIDEDHCERNQALEELVLNYKDITDKKYGTVLTTLTGPATHPGRYQETAAGNLLTDLLAENLGLDLAMLGSGSLRKEEIGPIITLGSLTDMYPFDEKMMCIVLTGEELVRGMEFVLRNTPEDDQGHAEYYQVSRGFSFAFSRWENRITRALWKGKPIPADKLFRVGLEGFHVNNLERFTGLDAEKVIERFQPITAAGNIRQALEEYMRSCSHRSPALEGRTEILS